MHPVQRRIDHVVFAVHNLDDARAYFDRLGFIVGAHNRHPWGTENCLIQFASSFVELITIGKDAQQIPPHSDAQPSFGAFVRDHLAERQGLAMLCLDSNDAVCDSALFALSNLGAFEPFHFRRKATSPDGTLVDVAFSLAFAQDPSAVELGFFVCQQHHPENFWNASFQKHPNGATDIAGVTLTSRFPVLQSRFLKAFSGSPAALRSGDLHVLTLLNDGWVEVIPTISTPQFTGLNIRITDLPRQVARLNELGIHYRMRDEKVAIAAFDSTITFEQS